MPLREVRGKTLYRFLVIEDDEQTATLMVSLVQRYLDEHDVDAKVELMPNAFEFVELKRKYDLIFMDIGLPGISGMEAAEVLRTTDDETLLIFVTDLAQFAVKGYEVGALDFVVKPVNYQSLSMRLDRAIRILKRREYGSVFLVTKHGARVFPLASLVYVEVRGHNLEYHVVDEESIKIRGTLAKFEEEQGASSQFVRISNSCLVNADHIRSVNGNMVRMSNGDELPISRTKKKAALEALAAYFGGSR